MILKLYLEHGKKWSLISEKLNNGKPENHIKNRFYGYIKKTYLDDSSIFNLKREPSKSIDFLWFKLLYKFCLYIFHIIVIKIIVEFFEINIIFLFKNKLIFN